MAGQKADRDSAEAIRQASLGQMSSLTDFAVTPDTPGNPKKRGSGPVNSDSILDQLRERNALWQLKEEDKKTVLELKQQKLEMEKQKLEMDKSQNQTMMQFMSQIMEDSKKYK
jgi:hypothetical protein